MPYVGDRIAASKITFKEQEMIETMSHSELVWEVRKLRGLRTMENEMYDELRDEFNIVVQQYLKCQGLLARVYDALSPIDDDSLLPKTLADEIIAEMTEPF